MERSVAAETEIRVAFARARRVLLEDPGAIFSEFRAARPLRDGRLFVELSVPLGAGASAHQEVEMLLGTARATDAGFELPLRWRATGREQLFPRFIGQLTLSEVRTGTRVQLTGSYAVPLGTIGRFGDGVVGHRLVRRSLNALVDLLGARLETEVARRIASTSSDRDARFATPDKHDRSEFYAG